MTTYSQDKTFISEVIGSDLLQNAINWIAQNLSPDDVFADSELEEWAEDNGYVKKD